MLKRFSEMGSIRSISRLWRRHTKACLHSCYASKKPVLNSLFAMFAIMKMFYCGVGRLITMEK